MNQDSFMVPLDALQGAWSRNLNNHLGGGTYVLDMISWKWGAGRGRVMSIHQNILHFSFPRRIPLGYLLFTLLFTPLSPGFLRFPLSNFTSPEILRFHKKKFHSFQELISAFCFVNFPIFHSLSPRIPQKTPGLLRKSALRSHIALHPRQC